MTKKEYEYLQERYDTATKILLDIETTKGRIKSIEDVEFFDSMFSKLEELYRIEGSTVEEIKQIKENLRVRALRTLRGTLINLEQKFKDL
jgi:hypothetical protein